MYCMFLVYQHADRVMVEQFDDLETGVAAAIKLADDSGWPAPIDGDERPDRVEVHSGGRVELSIKVMRGGLLGSRAGPKSQPM